MEGDSAHHLGNVLRAQGGQIYELSDGSVAWLARIESVGRNRVEFALLEELPAPKPVTDVTLLLSIVKFDAFEWAIEKATELGVTRITPVAAARSEKGLLAAAAKRSQRWNKILLEASQQSRRLRIPQLDEPAKPVEAFAGQASRFCLMLSERSDAPSIRTSLDHVKLRCRRPRHWPGGRVDRRRINFRSCCGIPRGLSGQLILRTETAVIAALATLNFALSPD